MTENTPQMYQIKWWLNGHACSASRVPSTRATDHWNRIPPSVGATILAAATNVWAPPLTRPRFFEMHELLISTNDVVSPVIRDMTCHDVNTDISTTWVQPAPWWHGAIESMIKRTSAEAKEPNECCLLRAHGNVEGGAFLKGESTSVPRSAFFSG